MQPPPLTVQLPATLYAHLQQRAEQAQHPVEMELVAVLTTVFPEANRLAPELQALLATLPLMTDAELWQALRSQFAQAFSEQLEALHFKQQREGLTAQEQAEEALLVRQYDRQLLLRAKAAALLTERGHDLTGLVPG